MPSKEITKAIKIPSQGIGLLLYLVIANRRDLVLASFKHVSNFFNKKW